MGAAAGIVIGKASRHVMGEADVVVRSAIGVRQNVDESLVLGHPKAKARPVPERWNAERAEMCATTERRSCDPSAGDGLQKPRHRPVERHDAGTEV
jgi:hypothetical protein